MERCLYQWIEIKNKIEMKITYEVENDFVSDFFSDNNRDEGVCDSYVTR